MNCIVTDVLEYERECSDRKEKRKERKRKSIFDKERKWVRCKRDKLGKRQQEKDTYYIHILDIHPHPQYQTVVFRSKEPIKNPKIIASQNEKAFPLFPNPPINYTICMAYGPTTTFFSLCII